MLAGANAAVTPVGMPVAVRAIAPLKPPRTALVMVDVPDAPARTVSVAGDLESVKLEVTTRLAGMDLTIAPLVALIVKS